MPALESDLRRQLETVIIEAREVAEAAAHSKLTNLGVAAPEAFNDRDRDIRNRLRARGRQVGDVINADKTQSIEQLTQELAYEYWHRMLFARFLAENGLLIDPDLEVGVNLEYCHEVATSKGASNGFVLAARYASKMLPQIFRSDDVLLEIDIAPDQRLALEKLLDSLPPKTFLADDSLGWVYQFWQTKRKKEVNDSGKPIDGHTLPAVTQLFTEHYMVEFLLHNTIGAWWCGRHNVQGPPGGAGVTTGESPVEMPYLRWRDDGTPAAGKFEGWPKSLAEFTMLDPCCGSGHFLVAVFNFLVPLRMYDEGLTAEKACEAVLGNNIFGLEIDPRCTQIAAFALALAAWKYTDAVGYRQLPTLNIACSGQAVGGKKDEWLTLANSNDRLREGMDRLYDLFRQAPHLGSLIEPRREKGDLYEAGYAELQPLLVKALAKKAGDVDLSAVGVAAHGITRAAELLGKRYTLVLTNVPYLGRGKQDEVMKEYIDDYYLLGKSDLAMAFVLRCLELCRPGGSTSLVTPQNWLFLKSYENYRIHIFQHTQWNFVARLGAGAFETITGEVVNVALFILSPSAETKKSMFSGIDVSNCNDIGSKKCELQSGSLDMVDQGKQLKNPDARLLLKTKDTNHSLLSVYADSFLGLGTGDYSHYGRCFWELPAITTEWSRQQGSVDESCNCGGRTHLVYWDSSIGRVRGMTDGERVQIHNQDQSGRQAWGKAGVGVSLSRELYVTRYTGEPFDKAMAVLVPKKTSDLPALWEFCNSDEFGDAVRDLDTKTIIANGTLVKVPFDADRWRQLAASHHPNGLDEITTSDPTQWLFKGDIATSIDPLQVAVSRLLSYRWPNQPKTADVIDKLADSEGIVCLPGVRGKATAAERLLEVLHAAYEKNWSDSQLHKLLTDDGCKAGSSLDDWLFNQFFEQHCRRSHNRPFIWHIWDGRKDGFSALVNYHKLTHQALENLTYSYLGDWITAQGKSDKVGADLRLGAAQALQKNLELILAGDPPYDIFVRWKPLHEQAIGWNPDLNDGVRQNIRPFIKSGILRKEPKSLLKNKDRGNEPERNKNDFPWFWTGEEFVGERVNDVHLKIADKQIARTRKKGVK